MKVIDSHVHLFQSAEAGRKAMRGMSQTGFWGTLNELEQVIGESGISYAATVATIPLKVMFEARIERFEGKDEERLEFQEKVREEMVERLRRYNRWLCQQARENRTFLPFIAIDPFIGTDGMLSEIEECFNHHGARGLKLHPMLGQYYPHASSLWPVYEKAQEMAIPLIFHGGRSPESPDVMYSHPAEFKPILDSFQRLKIVIAHIGMDFWDDSISMSRNFPNCFFDTSGAISSNPVEEGLSDTRAREIIHEIGINKVLFGSDFPWFNPKEDIERMENLGLKDHELEMIFHKNAVRVFGLE